MHEPEPEASPAQQEAVRRLLAAARHDEPVPPEVAARLDAVLDQLATEGERAIDPPPPAEREAVVHDLAVARRRRRATGLLAAAAAVVVLGVGIGQLDLSPSGDDSEASGSSAESADQGAGGDSSGSLREEPAEEAAPNAFSPPSDAPVITPDGFKETVDQLRDQAMVRANGASTLDADLLTTDSMFVCEPTAFGPGRLLAVRYDGSPAVLAYRPPTGTTQSVELLQCGTGAVLRSVVLPYP